MLRIIVCGLACLATAGLLSGCGHTPFMSMYKLRNFDPVTTDLQRLRVAVRLPVLFKPGRDAVAIVVRHWRDGDKSKQLGRFVLVPFNDANDLAELVALAKPDTRLYGFRLRPEDIARFDRVRQKMRAAKLDKRQHGALDITAKVCRLRPGLPQKILVSTFLKTGRTGEFVPLLVDVDILQEIQRRELAREVPLCPGVAASN